MNAKQQKSDDHILHEIRDGVVYVTFNRPELRNAMTFEMYDRLAEIVENASADRSIRGMLFAGAGEKAFVAGTDISQFREFEDAADVIAYEQRIEKVLGTLERCRVPTVAAISGACTGGGAAIALCCDLRIAVPGARFGFPVARTLGNCLSMGNFARLVATIGPARTKELILTARLVDAAEAVEMGLVNRIVKDQNALMDRAEEVVRQMAGNAPLTIEAAKEAVRHLRGGVESEIGQNLLLKCYLSEDFKEGIDAFINKRSPDWKGR